MVLCFTGARRYSICFSQHRDMKITSNNICGCGRISAAVTDVRLVRQTSPVCYICWVMQKCVWDFSLLSLHVSDCECVFAGSAQTPLPPGSPRWNADPYHSCDNGFNLQCQTERSPTSVTLAYLRMSQRSGHNRRSVRKTWRPGRTFRVKLLMTGSFWRFNL